MISLMYSVSKTLAVISFISVLSLQAHNKPSFAQSFGSLRATQGLSTKPQSAELAEASDLTGKVTKLYRERKYDEALPLAKRAVQLRERTLGADDQLVRNAYFNLAEIYIALRKYGEAESSLQRVISSYKSAEPDDVRLSDVLDRMALVQYAQGDVDKSEAAYLKSLRIREKRFGADSANAAKSVLLLADLYQLTGKYEKAAPYYQRLISIREKSAGPSQGEELADALARYSCLMRKLNRAEEADAWERRILAARAIGNSGISSGSNNEALIKGGILNGQALSLPKPDYPAEARAARVSGTVVVQVVIDETGNVIRACAIHGPSKLWLTSEFAAYRSKFSPTKLNGMPVKVTGIITYNYVAR